MLSYDEHVQQMMIIRRVIIGIIGIVFSFLVARWWPVTPALPTVTSPTCVPVPMVEPPPPVTLAPPTAQQRVNSPFYERWN